MPEYPLLLLPSPTTAEKAKRGSGAGKISGPSGAEQFARLDPRMRALSLALERKGIQLQTSTSGIVPEEVLVLETVGTIQDFINAVRKIPELDWMVEWERDFLPDENFQDAEKPEKTLSGRLYLMMTTSAAIQAVLDLWNKWHRGEKLPHGFGKWGEAFQHLREIRFWNTRDRLETTGLLEDWTHRVETGAQLLPAEVELWFRSSPMQRLAAEERVRTLVREIGGTVGQSAVIEAIHYHALLVSLPRSELRQLEELEVVQLFLCEQIQFFRPVGQMVSVSPEGEPTPGLVPPPTGAPSGPPVVGLLDGLALENHQLLAGRLVVDDPDGWSPNYPAALRSHGTCMASLILHGDLNAAGNPLPNPIYLRPVLQPIPNVGERCPEDQLLVDLVHRAVRRMFVGEGGLAPVAPAVRAINFSIGDPARPYDQSMSSLARLLDWLSWEHKVLFLVSAGNQSNAVVLEMMRGEFEALGPTERTEQLAAKIVEEHVNRRLLSPAEGMNVLTVGSLHTDLSTPPQVNTVFLMDPDIPAPYSRQGPGYRGIVKPDFSLAGGRNFLRLDIAAPQATIRYPPDGTGPPGHLTATPGSAPGQLNLRRHCRGTSNSAALATRQAAEFIELLSRLRNEPGGHMLGTVPDSLWLKVLLVHGASWPEATADLVSRISNCSHTDKAWLSLIRRLTGYGLPDFQKVATCTDRRVTVLSGGALREDQGHTHHLPLPVGLSGLRGWRTLTVTLAYFTPIEPRRREYSVADLWFKIENRESLQLGGAGADHYVVQRGTVQHTTFTGEAAAVIQDQDSLNILVSCRRQTGSLPGPVPYALAVTLEVAPALNTSIYTEVRDRIRQRLRIRPPD